MRLLGHQNLRAFPPSHQTRESPGEHLSFPGQELSLMSQVSGISNVHPFMFTLLRGWTIFDKLYIYNGTVYLVSDEPETFPNRTFMISSGAIVENTAESAAARLPTDKDLRIISTSAARKLFGTGANRVQGVTVRAFIALPETSP